MNSDNYVVVVDEIVNTDEQDLPFGKRWANQLIRLTLDYLQALKQGKFLAIDDQGEYMVYLALEGGCND
jgi:hypothetical protein